MNPHDRTTINDTWNCRHNVRCPGCKLGEWYGIPKHEKGCREARTWFALPSETPAWARAHAERLDVSQPGKSPEAFEDRLALKGLNYFSHALWHMASTIEVSGRFDTR